MAVGGGNLQKGKGLRNRADLRCVKGCCCASGVDDSVAEPIGSHEIQVRLERERDAREGKGFNEIFSFY